MRLQHYIIALLILSLTLWIAGCHQQKHTRYLLQHPEQLHHALQHCSKASAMSTQRCQHLKRIKLVLADFLDIAHRADQNWLSDNRQHEKHSPEHFQAFRHNAAFIQQQFAKHIMSTQQNLVKLRQQRQAIEKQLGLNKNSQKLVNKLDKINRQIYQNRIRSKSCML